jgi:hypothetical protein
VNEKNVKRRKSNISGSGSDFLTNYGSGSASKKVKIPTVPVPVPQHWLVHSEKSQL